MKTCQIVGLCVLCSLFSGGTVAMMGAARQPEPERPHPRPTAEAGDLKAWTTQERERTVGLATANTEHAHPAMVAAPGGGFVVLVAATGQIFVITGDGSAEEVMSRNYAPDNTIIFGYLNATTGLPNRSWIIPPKEQENPK